MSWYNDYQSPKLQNNAYRGPSGASGASDISGMKDSTATTKARTKEITYSSNSPKTLNRGRFSSYDTARADFVKNSKPGEIFTGQYKIAGKNAYQQYSWKNTGEDWYPSGASGASGISGVSGATSVNAPSGAQKNKKVNRGTFKSYIEAYRDFVQNSNPGETYEGMYKISGKNAYQKYSWKNTSTWY